MIFWYCICKYHGGAQRATKEGPAEDIVNRTKVEQRKVCPQANTITLPGTPQEKVEAIRQLSQPDNMQVLGMVKYQGNYIPNLSTTA
jgi:hypothetical protein